ncbi:nesprin-2, partial [Lates japonicus]
VILSSKSNGEAQVMELKRRAQSLCEQKDLEGEKKAEVQQMVIDTEQQWRTVLRDAEETQRELKGVVKRLVSCQRKRDQAEARLAELQKQTSNLPRVFPWPGLGERRQAVEQAQTLLEQSTALAPVFSDLHSQAAKLFELTQDHDWADPSWAAKEESIPALLKELTDAKANLEQGVLTERQCTQLVEQHEAAQDWLREQVKGLGAPPTDRQGLHSAVNTLKALLQTVDREQREMKELDSARDNLLSLCTPGGRDALTLEVSQLHDLCATSEKEVRERLTACEARLEELESQVAKRAQELKERAAALQWELRSLDQALSYSEPQNNITQLQQHWHSLQNCEKSLEDLGVKVHDLHQEVKSTPATNELPAEIISVVESLGQQHDSSDKDQGRVRQKPSSTPEVVTVPTEITVVTKGEFSPTKQKSKDEKPSPELAATEPTKTKEEPDSQKPSSTLEMVTAPTEITVVEKGELSPTKEKSKDEKLSPERATIEPTTTKEEPDTQKTSSTPEVVTASTEITVVKKGELSPTKRKSKGLKPSPELATTEPTKTKEEPDDQKSSSAPEMFIAPTEIIVVEKGELSPTTQKLKSQGASRKESGHSYS